MKKAPVLVLMLWILSVALVVYLSTAPKVNLPAHFRHSDKLLHYLAYSWLGFLPLFAFRRKAGTLAAIAAMLLLGAGMEGAQAYIPARQACGWDMAANTSGVFTGTALGIFLRTRLGFASIRPILSFRKRRERQSL